MAILGTSRGVARWLGRHYRRRGVVVVCLLIGLSGFRLVAQQSLEDQVKGAFLLNFTKFIEWPSTSFAEPGSPFNICVMEDESMGHALELLIAGETVAGRRLSLQRLKSAPSPQQCQVLFVGKSDRDIGKLLRPVTPGLLTVGEGKRFLGEGGMIGFVIDNHRVRFAINQTRAGNAALKLSSKLLSVAIAVEK